MKKNNTKHSIDRLVVVSNRLPLILTTRGEGKWEARPSTGGLVTALTSVLTREKGLWIGWPGLWEEPDLGRALIAIGKDMGYALEPVWLTKAEIDHYYFGFSNEIMWPLFHDLQTRCNFDPAYWNMYQAVNRKFANTILNKVSARDYIWVQDYHLMLLAKELRRLGVTNKIGFFLHIPFPNPDMCIKLPWREDILKALLEFDLLGFQTRRDRNNFMHCVEVMFKNLNFDTRKQLANITIRKQKVMVGSFPISIDFRALADQAASEIVAEKAKQLRNAMPNRQIILGVDRLDYTKGIPEKLLGFKNALERFAALRSKISLIQVIVPSREDIFQYKALRSEIEGLVSEINGKFTQAGWIPIHYLYRHLDQNDLLAYYRAADIALITPLKDGMNLVAKEYCAANVDENGVLILSEFAGAAYQLGSYSLLVNPYDVIGMANTINRAYKMGIDERKRRMQRTRKAIARRDVYWWVDSYLEAAYGS